MSRSIRLTNFALERESVLAQVLDGLMKKKKELPSKLFYDAEGSRLFDRITELPEYYPTRTETAIMTGHIDDMAGLIGSGAMLIEFGSGSSEKSQILLDHLVNPAVYVPIDISRKHLLLSAERIATRYPDIEVLPVCADYTGEFELPRASKPVRNRVLYYPGSTIGNFHRPSAIRFLRRIARLEGVGGGLLIGVDLQKDRTVLERAYNDKQGVTAAFNLNMLVRLNREVESDFDVEAFEHRAFYNVDVGRIEMHLVSRRAQTVHIGDADIEFHKGESIWTESSYKYTIEGFERLARDSGFSVDRVWTDDASLFSVQYLSVVEV